MVDENNINKNESIRETSKQLMKPIVFVRKLYNSFLNNTGGIKGSEEYSEDFIQLLEKSGYKDSKDRVDFCIQLVYWLEHSQYINSTTKEYIKSNDGLGMRAFFQNRNNRIIRYNQNKSETELTIPVENVNTCISRVTADIGRLHMIFDDEIYNNIMFEKESFYWKEYKRKFLKEAEKYRFMTVDLSEFLFKIPADSFNTNIPSDAEFLEMLNVISLYSKKSQENVMKQISKENWEYLLYLCSCNVQHNKDKYNYELLQKVINGTYNEISKEMVEQPEALLNEEEIQKLRDELEQLKKEIQVKDINISELSDSRNDLAGRNRVLESEIAEIKVKYNNMAGKGRALLEENKKLREIVQQFNN